MSIGILSLATGNRGSQPQCYCHGERSEDGSEITSENAAKSGCEYVYAFDEESRTMYVLSSYYDDGAKMIGMFGHRQSRCEMAPATRDTTRLGRARLEHAGEGRERRLADGTR